MAFDITPYIDKKPSEVRQLIRQGVIDFPTAGMCRGYAQANLVILPPEYADDFEEYTKKNPFPCPVLEIIRGTPETHAMGEGGNIVTDIPRYRVYENGVFTKELTDASEYWKDGYVGFLIGCSFSFEEALMAAGIPVRHIEMGCNVPMYKTNIQTVKAGPFEGPMVCSMRPMTGAGPGGLRHHGEDAQRPRGPGADRRPGGDPGGRGARVLALRRHPPGGGGERQAPHRHHPRSRPHVHHRYSQHGAQRLSGGSEAQIKFYLLFISGTGPGAGAPGPLLFLEEKEAKELSAKLRFASAF